MALRLFLSYLLFLFSLHPIHLYISIFSNIIISITSLSMCLPFLIFSNTIFILNQTINKNKFEKISVNTNNVIKGGANEISDRNASLDWFFFFFCDLFRNQISSRGDLCSLDLRFKNFKIP